MRETIAFHRATQPLVEMLTTLEAGFENHQVHVELQRNLHDVLDHAIKTVERADSFRVLLQNALTVQSTLVTQTQNDEMRRLSATSLEQGEQVKKISGWAAILFAPTLIAGIYGMNFRYMPELDPAMGVPFRPRAHARLRRGALCRVQAQRLAVTACWAPCRGTGHR